jgi:hypothetical protein
MNIEYEIIIRADISDAVRLAFAKALELQGKVKGDLSTKADRCKIICLAKVNEKVVGIGAIKVATEADFSAEKAAIPKLKADFQWELGYMYTYEEYIRKGIAKNIAKLLLQTYGSENLMASTEISANPGMVKILESCGFRLLGKPWKSGIHGNYLGLFLRFQ